MGQRVVLEWLFCKCETVMLDFGKKWVVLVAAAETVGVDKALVVEKLAGCSSAEMSTENEVGNIAVLPVGNMHAFVCNMLVVVDKLVEQVAL